MESPKKSPWRVTAQSIGTPGGDVNEGLRNDVIGTCAFSRFVKCLKHF